MKTAELIPSSDEEQTVATEDHVERFDWPVSGIDSILMRYSVRRRMFLRPDRAAPRHVLPTRRRRRERLPATMVIIANTNGVSMKLTKTQKKTRMTTTKVELRRWMRPKKKKPRRKKKSLRKKKRKKKIVSKK